MNYELLKVISRKSPLALLQVKEVFGFYPELEYELIVLESYGDTHKEISLLENPPGDLFTRELDMAVLDGTADLAVHSAKDLPYPLAPGLELIALLDAFDQTDSLVSRNNISLKQLPTGSKVGTSSPTRRNELLAIRPDVEVVSIRGTIEERILLVDSGKIDALIVASCALQRLGVSGRVTEELLFATHPLQGNLAIVARSGSPELKTLFKEKDIRQKYGKVTLVGFGPGNPDLLTIGGDKALAAADIVFHDDLLDKHFLGKYTAEKVYVGKRKDRHSFEQKDINRLLLDAAKAGKSVVRLKGGDPMVFAHGGEEIEYLQSNFVEVDVIPGVSSGIAVSALTKVPLTHRGIASSVAFISGHSHMVGIPQADTLVFYMGGSNIRSIAQKIIATGKDLKTPVMLTYNVSMPDQQEFFSTLEDLVLTETKFATPVIIVIGDVVSLRNNSEQQVLKPVILVTGNQTEHYGQIGRVIHQPLIHIEKIYPDQLLDDQLNRLNQFDWLFFTSRYAVNFFFEVLEKKGKDSRILSGLRIASVGNVTSGALRLFGIIPDLQATEESSEGLLKIIQAKGITQGKVLIPRSDIGLPVLPVGLTQLGWEVSTVPVYRNTIPTDVKPLDLSEVQIIVFSSPSCVTNFKQVYGHFPEGKQYIFRGKETEKRYTELKEKQPQALKGVEKKNK